MGNACSARETLIYLQRTSPRFVFLCGIAGTLDQNRVGLGDVVIARSVKWWNLNKISTDDARPNSEGRENYLQLGQHFLRKAVLTEGEHTNYWDKRLTEFESFNKELLRSNTNYQLLSIRERLQGKKNKRTNLLHYGKIISWEYVLSDEVIRGKLRRDSQGGLAIEMEGGGFSSSVRRHNEELKAQERRTQTEVGSDIVGFVFRGISDLAHKKGSEPEEWRKIAMLNTAEAVVNFLRTFTGLNSHSDIVS